MTDLFAMATGKKLLVVDDSLTIQKVIRLALANEGYEIQAVSNGDEALQQMSLFRPDIVLIDVSMPGKNTYDIRRETLQDMELARSRFVLMSSAFETVDETKLADLQFHGRLIKPFDPSHLRQVLDEVMKQEVKPVVPPPMTAPPPSVPENIWSEEKTQPSIRVPEFTMPQTPSPAQASPEEDIRNLTETTIKMSGLDNFQWSVNENAILQESKPKPAVVSDDRLNQLQNFEPDLSPGQNYLDAEDTSLQIDSVPIDDIPQSFDESPMVASRTFSPSGASANPNPNSSPSPDVLPLTTDQMEKLMSSQFEKVLEQVARRMFPDIAEKIIRDEIRKLLSNPP